MLSLVLNDSIVSHVAPDMLSDVLFIFDAFFSRDAKLCVIPKNLTEIIREIEHIVSIKCNKEASKVSMIVAKVIFTAINVRVQNNILTCFTLLCIS